MEKNNKGIFFERGYLEGLVIHNNAQEK